jgi:hypothetical protein
MSSGVRRSIPLLIVFAALVSACRPLVMTPEASLVAIAPDAGSVGGCKLRGEVFALAPFQTADEPVDQLKIRAEGIGADTLLISRKEEGQTVSKDWKARAYRCVTGSRPAEIEASAVGGK